MFALIQMLHNNKENKWHPIFYYDSPLPGGFEDGSLNSEMLRYKSKGHHTQGFDNREAALTSAQDLEKQLIEQHNIVTVNTKEDIEWDGEDIPSDQVLFPYPENAAI